MMIQGAPNDNVSTASTTLATIHDDLDSIDCTSLSYTWGDEKKNSVMTSRHADTTVVARLTMDRAAAARMQDALADHFGEGIAVSIAQESEGAPDERWSLTLHFRARPDEGAVRALIAAIAEQVSGEERARRLAQDLRFETLAPADWVRESLEGLTPVDAGRFVVHGAHHRGRFPANRIAIQIDAGLAFGTGHHGSTRGCLLALDRMVKRTNRRPVGWAKSSALIYPRGHGARTIPARRRGQVLPARIDRRARAFAHPTAPRRKHAAVLDLGTGTGVLAIAAAKALHRPVLASDNDRRAVRIARNNARINGVGGSIEIMHAAGIGARRFRQRGPFDLVLANILLEPLQQFATAFAGLVAPNGHVVLSGLLNAQARAALASYGARGFSLRQRITLGGWTTLVVTRRGRV
jgi:ribosomal protein L11 methyltransferase